jgi:hypothetical protein
MNEENTVVICDIDIQYDICTIYVRYHTHFVPDVQTETHIRFVKHISSVSWTVQTKVIM